MVRRFSRKNMKKHRKFSTTIKRFFSKKMSKTLSKKMLKKLTKKQKKTLLKLLKRKFGSSSEYGPGFMGQTSYPSGKVPYFGSWLPWIQPSNWSLPVADSKVQLQQMYV